MSAKGFSVKGSYTRSVSTTAAFNLFTTAVSAVTGLVLARLLSPTGRGHFAAVSAYFGLSLVIFELGIGSAVVYFIAKLNVAQAHYVRTASALLLPLGLFAAIATEVLGLALRSGSPTRASAFMVLPLSIIVTFAGAAPTFALQSLSLGKWNLVRLAQPAAFLMLIVSTALMSSLSVLTVVNLMTISLIVQTSLSWYFYTRINATAGHLTRRYVRPMLRFGMLNMSSNAPNSLNSRLDQLVLAAMVSSAALGQYAVAVSISVLATPLVVAFGNVAFPSLARGERILEIIRASTRGSLLVSLLVCGSIAAAGPWLIPRLLGPAYQPVTWLVLILAPGAAVVAVNQVMGDILRGVGRPGAVAVCEWLGLVFTVLGLTLLVPRLGTVGAAITSTVTYLVVFVLLRAFVSRHTANYAGGHIAS